MNPRVEAAPSVPRATGEVVLEGPFVARHAEELLRRIDSVAAASAEDHPEERILGTARGPDRLLVVTSSQDLALRLGREIVRTFHGAASHHWSESARRLRIVWHREWTAPDGPRPAAD